MTSFEKNLRVNEKEDGQETYRKKNKPNMDGGKDEIQNKNKYRQ